MGLTLEQIRHKNPLRLLMQTIAVPLVKFYKE